MWLLRYLGCCYAVARVPGVVAKGLLRYPETHHQTPMTCTYGFSHFRHLQNCCYRDEIQFLNT